jgi:hypothetical protein
MEDLAVSTICFIVSPAPTPSPQLLRCISNVFKTIILMTTKCTIFFCFCLIFANGCLLPMSPVHVGHVKEPCIHWQSPQCVSFTGCQCSHGYQITITSCGTNAITQHFSASPWYWCFQWVLPSASVVRCHCLFNASLPLTLTTITCVFGVFGQEPYPKLLELCESCKVPFSPSCILLFSNILKRTVWVPSCTEFLLKQLCKIQLF